MTSDVTVVDWKIAERVAARVSGREPFSDSYHYDSLTPDFEEFTARAQDLVEAETGLRSLAGPARGRVADRPEWVRANIASFQRLLQPVIGRLGERASKGAVAPVARVFAGAEVGVMLGWMSTRVLGQYDLLVIEEENPHDQDLVYYVGPNVLALEKLYSFPPREFRLWLALHEVTHRTQFTGVPWMREHFLGLVNRVLDGIDPDPRRLFDGLARATDAIRSGRNPLENGGVMGLMVSGDQRAALDEVGGLMSLLEGHGDVIMDRAGRDLIPSAGRFAAVLSMRRQSARGATRLLQQLIGLEAKLEQYEAGERFIRSVEEAGGQSLFNLVWEAPENLPSMAEIRDPSLWVSRMQPASVQ